MCILTKVEPSFKYFFLFPRTAIIYSKSKVEDKGTIYTLNTLNTCAHDEYFPYSKAGVNW